MGKASANPSRWMWEKMANYSTNSRLTICHNMLPADIEYAYLGNITTKITSSRVGLAASAPRHWWFEAILLIICVFGIGGNIMNLLVLSRRRLLSSMDRLEKSATYGLIALAFSDMMFCIIVFPHCFLTEHRNVTGRGMVFELYYKIYGIALVNTFLMISTWLIVCMAVNRFIVVVYPFQARTTFGTKITLLTILMIFILSAVVTLPFYLHVAIMPCIDYAGNEFREVRSRWPQASLHLRTYMRWVWPVLADFIPVGILAFCNIRLIKELKIAMNTRQRNCHRQPMRDRSHRITLILVIIVLMLILLVSPSEILRYINPYNLGHVGYTLVNVTNILQACNFAMNFALYCAVNVHFRHTMKAMFTSLQARRQRNEHLVMRVTMTQLTNYNSDSKSPIEVQDIDI